MFARQAAAHRSGIATGVPDCLAAVALRHHHPVRRESEHVSEFV
jgi:hypothetical protein